MVRELLERNANVNSTTKKGNAAIHIASLGTLQANFLTILLISLLIIYLF